MKQYQRGCRELVEVSLRQLNQYRVAGRALPHVSPAEEELIVNGKISKTTGRWIKLPIAFLRTLRRCEVLLDIRRVYTRAETQLLPLKSSMLPLLGVQRG